jgi:hypothetical protein
MVGQHQHSLYCYYVCSSLFTSDKVNLLKVGERKVLAIIENLH